MRFVALLQTALGCGRAHLADRRGQAPEKADLRGWHRQVAGRWTPAGVRIGWVVGSDVFLDPMASYRVAQQLAAGEPLAVSEQAIRHRLRQRGLLASVDPGRQMVQVRRTLEGISRQVLHLKVSQLAASSGNRRA